MKHRLTFWEKELSAPENAARLLYLCGGAFCLVFGLIPPIGYGIANPGVLAIFLGGAALVCAALFLPAAKNTMPRLYKILHPIFFLAFIAAAAIYIAFSWSYRAYCAQNPPPEQGGQTVIVLGGAIKGDKPNLMLARRLDVAVQYLQKNQQAACIVSGGQGRDEAYTEAYVMKKYLVQSGIAADRIYEEGGSSTTKENISFSDGIIERHGLPRAVVIATDSFHQLRAAYFCERQGLDASAVCAQTPWGLLPSFEVRELGAWVKALMGF